MIDELEYPSTGMHFMGLLTHTQKRAGYFVNQDPDFVWLWKARNGHADIVAIFLYENATIKQVRESAEADMVKDEK